MDAVRIELVRPCRRGGWFGAELTRWLLSTASVLPGVRLRPVHRPSPEADARVLVVRDGGRAPDLAPVIAGSATLPVALVAYGGRTRGRPALEHARATLEHAGVPAATPSLGLNAAAVREHGFADADALLWSLLLDELRDAAVPA